MLKVTFYFPFTNKKNCIDHLAKSIDNTEFVALDCIKGHDSFLVEMDAFRPVISKVYEVAIDQPFFMTFAAISPLANLMSI